MSDTPSGLWGHIRRSLWWLPFGQVPELSAEALHGSIASEAPPALLDVRTHAEWSRSRIAGALNVPITGLKRRLPELGLDPRHPVVVICLSAHRSVPAVRLLEAHGYQDARQLAGGMLAWWRSGLPTEHG
jgi:rhodanese-related sulfurtransferase